MTDQQIATALREHLDGTPDASPIVWENAAGTWNGSEYTLPDAPFWQVSQITTPPERLGIVDAHVTRGRMVVAVMARLNDPDGLAQTAETEAEKIIARFPVNTRLAVGDRFLLVVGRPYADAGFNDGAYWRVNVHIRWQFIG